jgi:hypothetical protein
MQENYIYNLIEKDGLLIGMDLYSKKYKRTHISEQHGWTAQPFKK